MHESNTVSTRKREKEKEREREGEIEREIEKERLYSSWIALQLHIWISLGRRHTN